MTRWIKNTPSKKILYSSQIVKQEKNALVKDVKYSQINDPSPLLSSFS